MKFAPTGSSKAAADIMIGAQKVCEKQPSIRLVLAVELFWLASWRIK